MEVNAVSEAEKKEERNSNTTSEMTCHIKELLLRGSGSTKKNTFL
jgi:hypothetical protein